MTVDVLCTDSVKWLQEQSKHSIKNIVTGIPDLNELGDITLDEYLIFFNHVSQLIFERITKNGYCVFIQTDRRIDGQWIDKSYLLTDMAYHMGLKLLWHKIVCQRDVGKTDLYRPTYSHVICYTYTGTPGAAFPDVFPVGDKSYENATPSHIADIVVSFLVKQTKKQKKVNNVISYDIVDPFVGRGTIGLSAIKYGMSFLGIDIDPNQCQITRDLLFQQ